MKVQAQRRLQDQADHQQCVDRPDRRPADDQLNERGWGPHYGGDERRIEPHLLDFEGDLYGQRLVVELWQRLRDERAFGSEADLVAQIARDVEAARAAERPV